MKKTALTPKDPAAEAGGQTFITRSEDETFHLAEKLALSFKGNEVVLMTGPLGAGKTVFAKGIAAGAGVKNPNDVNSPSFTLLNIYDGRFRVYHFDLYRLERPADILDLGWEDILGEGLVLVEWAEKLPFTVEGIVVRIAIGVDDERRITIVRP